VSGSGLGLRLEKIFRAPVYRAHCAVIFAIAQLSCIIRQCCESDAADLCRDASDMLRAFVEALYGTSCLSDYITLVYERC